MKPRSYSNSLCNASTVVAISLLLILVGCNDNGPSSNTLRVAVTTSTRDSGLLDTLLPTFETKHNVRVDVIAKGTGAALQLGRSGDVDVVIVHARAAEDQYMSDGHGVRREDLMYNTFEIVGPEDDPAGVRSASSPSEALKLINNANARFVSRGDNSGTHQREEMLWNSGGGRPDWTNYIESGQGMGATLNMAEEMQAYTLTDRGTFLKYRSREVGLNLVSLTQEHEDLKNPYGIIVVSNAGANAELAHAFVDFMISKSTQKDIGAFRISGEPLFFPAHQEH